MLPDDPTKDTKYNESIIDSVRSQKDEVSASITHCLFGSFRTQE